VPFLPSPARLVETGHSDASLIRLRFRCGHCGSRRIDAVCAATPTVIAQLGRDGSGRALFLTSSDNS
jgi:hypothetical protein